MVRILVSLYFIVGLSLVGCAQHRPVEVIPHFPDAPDFSGVDLAPDNNKDRETSVTTLWSELCPTRLTLQKIRGSRYHNMICKLPGNESGRLIIGAHYDLTGRSKGVADNWSGVLITSELLRHFESKNNTSQNTSGLALEFIAFGEEEDGMFGARQYLRDTDTSTIVGMINIDTLGMRSLLLDGRSEEGLSALAIKKSEALGIQLDKSTWYEPTGDFEPFRQAGIPALNINSVDRSTARKLHSHFDRPGTADVDRLEEAFVLFREIIEALR